MKVCHVLTRLNIGGPALFVGLLCRHLRSQGHSTTVVAGRLSAGEGDMSYAVEGCDVVRVPSLRREIHPVDDLLALWSLVRLFRRERPDVVHTHLTKAGFLGRLAARLAGVPVVVHTYHGHVLEGHFGWFKSRVFELIERVASRLSDHDICVSRRVLVELEEHAIGHPDRTSVVEPGLDLSAFVGAPRRTGVLRRLFGIPSGLPVVGMCGRLVDVKDPLLVLDSVAAMDRSGCPAHLVFIGDGEMRAEVEERARLLGLEGRVHVTGWRRDVPQLVADLDLLMIASRQEALPFTLVEAAAAGVPVVSTPVGIAPEFLADPGLGSVVQGGDAAEFASAALSILGRPPLSPGELEGRRARIAARFDPVARSAAVLELYETLRARNSASGR